MDERERWDDMEETKSDIGKPDDVTDDPLRLLSHTRADPHQRAHVNLSQEEYTPEEVSRMLGTSLEVIMHAARTGDLKAERAGSKVVCIKHADLVDWMNRESSGV